MSCDAVEGYIVDLFARAIEEADLSGDPRDVARARDAAVAHMLQSNPAVVAYLRRAILDDSGHRGRIFEMLTDLTSQQVTALRSAGIASTEHPELNQVIGILVRQLGQLFLQPLIDRTWAQLADAALSEEEKPRLVIRLVDPSEDS